MTDIATDSWKVVSKNKKKKVGRRKYSDFGNNCVKPHSLNNTNDSSVLTENDIEIVVNKILKFKEEFSSSYMFGKSVKEVFFQVLKNFDTRKSSQGKGNSKIYQIVAYGLGSFSTTNAILQMACLLCIESLMMKYFSNRKNNHNAEAITSAVSNEKNKSYKINIDVYDPVMNEIDSSIIRRLNCNPLSTNEECKRISNEKCLFYVPHGSLEMYGNLLNLNYKNKKLPNIILFGNSLSSYVINDELFCNGSQSAKNKSFINNISNNILPNTTEYVLHRNKLASKVITGNKSTSETATSKSLLSCNYIIDYEISLDGILERAFNDTSVHIFN